MSLAKIFVTFVLFLSIYILWRRRRYYLLGLKIKGPWSYPLIGVIPSIIRKEGMLKYMKNCTDKFGGSLFLTWVGPIPFVVVTEPQLIQDVLNSPNCIDKALIYGALRDGLGDGILVEDDPKWSFSRKVINKAFSHKVLLSYIPIFNDETNKLFKVIEDYCDKGEFNIMEKMYNFALSTALRTTMDRDISLLSKEESSTLIKDFKCLLRSVTVMTFSPWLLIPFIRSLFSFNERYTNAKKQVHLFTDNVVKEKLKESFARTDTTQPESEKKNQFINLAIELYKNGDIKYEEMAVQSRALIFAGLETSASIISYTIMLLAMFPEYQQKLFDEIRNICPHGMKSEITIPDTKQMVYLDMVLNESMRVMTPVPLVARKTSGDVTLSNGITIPAGVNIGMDIFNMHRRVDIWGEESHKFNPDNFLPSNIESKHPYAFVPFSKGPRNCVGWRFGLLSMKVCLAKLIRNYQFTTTFNFDDLEFLEDISLRLKEIPLVKVHRRQN